MAPTLLIRADLDTDASPDVHKAFGIHVTTGLVVIIVAGSLLLLGLVGFFVFGKGTAKVKALAKKCSPKRHQRKITPTLVVQQNPKPCKPKPTDAEKDDLATLAADDDDSVVDRMPPIMEEESTHGTVVGRDSHSC